MVWHLKERRAVRKLDLKLRIVMGTVYKSNDNFLAKNVEYMTKLVVTLQSVLFVIARQNADVLRLIRADPSVPTDVRHLYDVVKEKTKNEKREKRRRFLLSSSL